MKTIILAGGWGTRMGQHTEWIPKPMVNIGNRPMLWHIMKYYSHYGYNDFVICAGVKAQVIKEYFFNFQMHSLDFSKDLSSGVVKFHNIDSLPDWKVTVADTGLDTLKGGRIKRIEKHLTDENNMVTYGDGLSDINIGKLVEFHRSHNKLVTISGVHPPARFGEIAEIGGVVTNFSEKPQTSVGLINGGYMVFRRGLLDYLSTDESCDLEFGALEQLSREGEVMVFKHSGIWECIDHDRDLVHLNQLWRTKSAFWKVWE